MTEKTNNYQRVYLQTVSPKEKMPDRDTRRSSSRLRNIFREWRRKRKPVPLWDLTEMPFHRN